MIVTCPIDRKHKMFIATAHVTQQWMVNEKGDYIETIRDCVEVTHSPDQNDMFQCAICGAEAKVT